MELNNWQNDDIKINKPQNEHYVPKEPNALEKATIEARKQGMTYGKWQMQQTILKMKQEEEKQKKLAERKKKF